MTKQEQEQEQELARKLYEIDPYDKKVEWHQALDLLLKGHQCFYRYRDGNENNMDSIKNSYIWLSNPKEFNDPYDTDFYIDAEKVDNSYKRQLKQKNVKGLKKVLGNMKENIANATYIACFTGDKNNLPMWAHYADNHEGMCLEYKTSDIINAISLHTNKNESESCCFMPVIYQENVPVIDSKIFKDMVYCFGKKSILWIYENEWRMVIGKAKKHGSNIKKRGYIRAHKGVFLTDISPSSIYMGYKMNEENEETLKAICKKNNINLYKAKKIEKEYKLGFKKIYCAE